MVVWRIFRWELIGLLIRGKRFFKWNSDGKTTFRIKIVRSGQTRLFLRVSQAADCKLQKEKAICSKCSTNCLSPAGQPPRHSTVPFELWVLSLSFLILVLSLILSSFTTCFHFLSFEVYKLWGSDSPLYSIHLFFTYFPLKSNVLSVILLSDALNQCPLSVKDQDSHL